MTGPKLGGTIATLIRHYTPTIAGALAAWIASLGINLDSGSRAALVGGIGLAVAWAYTAVSVWAEKRWKWARWLLGAPAKPKTT